MHCHTDECTASHRTPARHLRSPKNFLASAGIYFFPGMIEAIAVQVSPAAAKSTVKSCLIKNCRSRAEKMIDTDRSCAQQGQRQENNVRKLLLDFTCKRRIPVLNPLRNSADKSRIGNTKTFRKGEIYQA